MKREGPWRAPPRAALPLLYALATACAPVAPPETRGPEPVRPEHAVIPAPASVRMTGGEPFTLTAATRIVVEPGEAEVARVGEQLAALLGPSTGFALPVSPAGDTTPRGSIALRLDRGRSALGEEGYELTTREEGVTLVASHPAGLFRGVQTLRQLLPPGIEAEQSVLSRGPWTVPAGAIVDRPRFAWRGAMLDVARHFFTVDEVKQYVDLLALYKINTLHLHLSDDQGWRIEIRSRPRLAALGGSTQVGGGRGGFYTQQEYAEIVRYAQDRYITVVPEIDVPGHTNAALVAYPELSCGKRPPAPYTGIEVGFSALCVDKEATYAFVEDVVRELAALTPGPYFHVGGDEVEALSHEEYARFIERVQEIVTRHGKRMVGWEEITKARLLPTTLAQQWKSDSATAALRHGAKLILSPASRAYLDMKYDTTTELGLHWAGYVEVKDAYDWDPATFLQGVSERDVVGVEAPLWSETVRNITAAQYLALPRLPAIAEVGWTPADRREWESFRRRLAAQAPRWHYLGVNYYRSPQVPWHQ
jgi:hexosaminidase